MDICQELDFNPNGRSICFCLELRNRVLLGGTYFKKKINGGFNVLKSFWGKKCLKVSYTGFPRIKI